MRLICPQCNALYDVPGEMIPPEGREVECSACGHVWHQHADMRAMRGLAGDLRGKPETVPSRAGAGDLGAPPELLRPLPDDVLSILREETALEVSARRAARGEALPSAASGAGETGVEIPSDSAGPGDEPAPVPAPEAASGSQKAADEPPNVAAPNPVADAARAQVRPAKVVPAPPTAASVPQPAAETSADWPATTVTAPDDSQPRVLSRPARKAGDRAARPVPIPAAPPRPLPAEPSQDAPVAFGPDVVPPAIAKPAEEPPPRRRVAKALPDVERLAATLQTQPSIADAALAVSAPDERPPEAASGGYRAGFSYAVAVSVALLVAYVGAAGWVRAGSAPAAVVGVIGAIDNARAGLRDTTTQLIGRESE